MSKQRTPDGSSKPRDWASLVKCVPARISIRGNKGIKAQQRCRALIVPRLYWQNQENFVGTVSRTNPALVHQSWFAPLFHRASSLHEKCEAPPKETINQRKTLSRHLAPKPVLDTRTSRTMNFTFLTSEIIQRKNSLI